ncbi:phosphoglycerate mutase-like protein [Exidia glandulosa HHB12029]|uniref:Phosphoglycerate mutase-like protein n=1 Tax=Exidia glandulosa HHB12029 TaxID=1314781 RepID=A0A165P1C2_EXIGL|nr:phosphoglycerate mutase-like protein [Exidia glandulosa HHB12029]
MTVTFYFIRHGQSVDNCKTTIWAGWKDSPLTNHGPQQAEALGAAFASTPLTAIYASPLKRAHSTALGLHAAQPSPKPEIIITPDLREQGFGVAEGKTHVSHGAMDLKQGIFPIIRGRTDKFPEGESRDDVRQRGARVLSEYLMPHILAARGHTPDTLPHRVAVVSHGICIAELLGAILYRVPSSERREYWFGGVQNTGWHCLEVGLLDEQPGVHNGPEVSLHDAPLKVLVRDINNHTHLTGLPKAPGGLGSVAHDPAQAKITAYLSGNTTAIDEDTNTP